MIDGTMMLGASRATLTFEQSILFITGVVTASFIWDHGITIGFNLLRDKLPKKVFVGNQPNQRNHRCRLRSVSDFNRHHRNSLERINIL